MGRKPKLFFGDGSDGDFVSTGDVAVEVGQDDGPPAVEQYGSFHLRQGHRLTVDRRCRGLIIYVQGDCRIDGIIDMSMKAPLSVPREATLPHIFPVSVSKGLLWPGQSIDPTDMIAAYLVIGGEGGDGGAGG